MENRRDISTAPAVKRYKKIATITVGAVVFLIFVGGLVRMTGSGMGCPDWPKCFGQWVPPTDVSQLPVNYQEIYSERGYAETEFNAFKTWTEYVNRLVGALIGFFAILTAVFSFPIRKQHPIVTFFSVFGLFLVIVQGGLGAYVVRTNLHTGMISLHMVTAMLILACYICAILAVNKENIQQLSLKKSQVSTPMLIIGFAAMIIVLSQIILGTQVREAVDVISKQMGNEGRETWISQLGSAYSIHKISYYVVVGGLIFWAYQLKDLIRENIGLKRAMGAIFGVLGLEILLGLGMHHFSIPPIMQPLHLLLATVLFGLVFTVWGTLWMNWKHIKRSSLQIALN